MKINSLYCVGIIIVIIIFGIGCEKKIDRFDIEKYAKYINDRECKYYGSVEKKKIGNEYDVKSIAAHVWRELYGEEVMKEKPYTVMRDKEEQAWLVHSAYKKNAVGGNSWIIIDNEGNVLAVWREK